VKELRHSINTAGIFFLLSIVLASCFTKERPPAGVLDKEEMVKVLAEIYLMEEKVNRLGLGSDSATIVFEKLKGKIFQKVGTEDSILRQSMSYYSERPKDMELIYTALVDSLNLREQRESVRDGSKPGADPADKLKPEAIE
jgi:hypothetical protein